MTAAFAMAPPPPPTPPADQDFPEAPARRRPRRRRRQAINRGTWVLLGLAGTALIVFPLAGGVDLAAVLKTAAWWDRLVLPLLRSLLFIGVGLFIGQLIEGSGLNARLGILAAPLIRRAHLPPEAGTAFTAAFASGVAANTLLYTSWQEGRLNRRQLILANLLNASLPAFLLHLPTTFFVVYALLGRVALIYFGLTLLAALLRLFGVALTARLMFPPAETATAAAQARRPALRELLQDTGQKFLTRLRRLLVIILPVYVVVFLLLQWGFFAWLGRALAGVVSSAFLPLEAMSVIVFAVMAEFTSGFAAAAAFVEGGSLTTTQVVVALLIGNVIATPVRMLRHQLPHYMGIYSPGLGLKLLAIGQSVRVASVVSVTIVYYWLS